MGRSWWEDVGGKMVVWRIGGKILVWEDVGGKILMGICWREDFGGKMLVERCLWEDVGGKMLVEDERSFFGAAHYFGWML